AIRQMKYDVGSENAIYIHLTLVPYISTAHEVKTKPTQHSVMKLREIGIQPDILLCRTDRPLSKEIKDKIALFCSVEPGSVFTAADVQTIYELPLALHEEGLDDRVAELLNIWSRAPRLDRWERIVKAIKEPHREVRGRVNANSHEFDERTPRPVVSLMEEQKQATAKGGTMRLGAYPCTLKPGSLASKVYGRQEISERHRHRYEINNAYRAQLEEKG